MTDKFGTEEEALCRRGGCCGRLKWESPENCSCHLGGAPCRACTSVRLHCPECHWVDDEDDRLDEDHGIDWWSDVDMGAR